MVDDDSADSDEVDDWLRAANDRLVAAIGEALDVEAGLADVIRRAQISVRIEQLRTSSAAQAEFAARIHAAMADKQAAERPSVEQVKEAVSAYLSNAGFSNRSPLKRPSPPVPPRGGQRAAAVPRAPSPRRIKRHP